MHPTKVSPQQMKVGTRLALAFLTLAAVGVLVAFHGVFPDKSATHNHMVPSWLPSSPTTIHFLEPSLTAHFNARQACAVESAAKHNPNGTIMLHFVHTEAPMRNHYLQTLSKYPNVVMLTLHPIETFAGTPLEAWYANDSVRSRPLLTEHLADALKLALLWKHGTMYLDLDVVVLRSLNHLRNTLVRTIKMNRISNRVMIFDKQHAFLKRCLQYFAETYQEGSWDLNGALLLSRNLECTEDLVRAHSSVAVDCNGVSVLPEKTFFPVPHTEWQKYFRPQDARSVVVSSLGSYTIHVWNKLSRTTGVVIGSGCAYDLAARINCPHVYSLATETEFF